MLVRLDAVAVSTDAVVLYRRPRVDTEVHELGEADVLHHAQLLGAGQGGSGGGGGGGGSGEADAKHAEKNAETGHDDDDDDA